MSEKKKLRAVEILYRDFGQSEYKKLLNEFCSYITLKIWLESTQNLEDPAAARESLLEEWKAANLSLMRNMMREYNSSEASKEIDTEDLREFKVGIMKEFEKHIREKYIKNI